MHYTCFGFPVISHPTISPHVHDRVDAQHSSLSQDVCYPNESYTEYVTPTITTKTPITAYGHSVLLSIVDGPLSLMGSYFSRAYQGVKHSSHLAHVFSPEQEHWLTGWIEWTQDVHHAASQTSTTEAIATVFVLDPFVPWKDVMGFATAGDEDLLTAPRSDAFTLWENRLWRKVGHRSFDCSRLPATDLCIYQIMEVCSRNSTDTFVLTNRSVWVFGIFTTTGGASHSYPQTSLRTLSLTLFLDQRTAWTSDAIASDPSNPEIAQMLLFWISVAMTPHILSGLSIVTPSDVSRPTPPA